MILTKSIEIANCIFDPMTWDEAVKACEALGDGWRLPNKEELAWMYEHKDEIGGFGEGWFWSSSQGSYLYDIAWRQRFFDGKQDSNGEGIKSAVRACRDVEAKQEEPFDINRLGRTVPVDTYTEEWRATRNTAIEAALTKRLRDKFAGQALVGWLANDEGVMLPNGVSTYEFAAQRAFNYADAMLAERAKRSL